MYESYSFISLDTQQVNLWPILCWRPINRQTGLWNGTILTILIQFSGWVSKYSIQKSITSHSQLFPLTVCRSSCLYLSLDYNIILNSRMIKGIYDKLQKKICQVQLFHSKLTYLYDMFGRKSCHVNIFFEIRHFLQVHSNFVQIFKVLSSEDNHS